MKHYRTCLSIAVLVAASIACQAVTGAGSDEAPVVPSSTDSAPQPEVEQPTAVFDDGNDNGSSDSSVSTDFPMTDDAFNVVEAGGILFITQIYLQTMHWNFTAMNIRRWATRSVIC
jgi:hypothetical protein